MGWQNSSRPVNRRRNRTPRGSRRRVQGGQPLDNPESTLCRVRTYASPGFPRPDDEAPCSRRDYDPSPCPSSFLPLAMTSAPHRALGAGDSGSSFHLGMRDGDDHAGRHPRGPSPPPENEILDLEMLADADFGDVDLDLLRNGGRETLDFHFASHEIEQRPRCAHRRRRRRA